MSVHQIAILCLISLFFFILPSFGAYLLFAKANKPAWQALIPVYNTFVMLKIAGRPVYWFFFQFIPVAGWFITLGIIVEFIKVYGKFKFYEHALTVFTVGLYFIYVGLDPRTKYIGPAAVRKYKKGTAREWVDAGVSPWWLRR